MFRTHRSRFLGWWTQILALVTSLLCDAVWVCVQRLTQGRQLLPLLQLLSRTFGLHLALGQEDPRRTLTDTGWQSLLLSPSDPVLTAIWMLRANHQDMWAPKSGRRSELDQEHDDRARCLQVIRTPRCIPSQWAEYCSLTVRQGLCLALYPWLKHYDREITYFL